MIHHIIKFAVKYCKIMRDCLSTIKREIGAVESLQRLVGVYVTATHQPGRGSNYCIQDLDQ